ncbi:hypothetical protein ES332_A08G119300v1 [Gossypium tomentosum]|uniref:Uncharacterized protein n=1 Tax=Gossypium tomentosum TaxID=34277 RepID=A0A5D2PHY6_GOSTO|nr:hypothetical protein ES332_A08G119300v1 [Gossypium tomentosum]
MIGSMYGTVHVRPLSMNGGLSIWLPKAPIWPKGVQQFKAQAWPIVFPRQHLSHSHLNLTNQLLYMYGWIHERPKGGNITLIHHIECIMCMYKGENEFRRYMLPFMNQPIIKALIKRDA